MYRLSVSLPGSWGSGLMTGGRRCLTGDLFHGCTILGAADEEEEDDEKETGRVGATGTGRLRDRLKASKVSAVREVTGEIGPFSWSLVSRKFLVSDFFQCLGAAADAAVCGSGLFMSRTTSDSGFICSDSGAMGMRLSVGEGRENTLPGEMVEDDTSSESIPLSASELYSNSEAIVSNLKEERRSPKSLSSRARFRSPNGNGRLLPKSFSLLTNLNCGSMAMFYNYKIADVISVYVRAP